MMSNTHKVWRLILLALISFGFIHLVINRTTTALIMLAMIGIIYYLYKRPPQWLIRRFTYPQSGPLAMRSQISTHRKNKKSSKKKKYPFRVIDGNKKDPLRIKKSQ